MSYTKHLRNDQWDRISGSLPGFSGTVGRPVEDNRRFVEGVIWAGGETAVVGGHCPLTRANGEASTNALNAGQFRGIWQMIFNTLARMRIGDG